MPPKATSRRPLLISFRQTEEDCRAVPSPPMGAQLKARDVIVRFVDCV